MTENKGKTAKKHISGIVQVTRKGTGYMPFDLAHGKASEDIEIFPEKLNGALNGDQVEVEILSLFPRPRGRVKKIVARAKTEFVCTVKGGQVLADDQRFNEPIQVSSTPVDGVAPSGGTAAQGWDGTHEAPATPAMKSIDEAMGDLGAL